MHPCTCTMQQTTEHQKLEGMDAWTKHQHLINSYVKHYHKSKETPQQDTNYKSERDILVENHKFLRSDEDDQDLTWEKRIAKKYYDKLFKEFALVDLKHFKDGRIAMRWRNEHELFRGKGQFTCGNLRCEEASGLQSWEVNFGYMEQGEKKNALVKVRLCDKDSFKLNYKTQRQRVSSEQDFSALTESYPSTRKSEDGLAGAESQATERVEGRDREKRRRHDDDDGLRVRERSGSPDRPRKSSRRSKEHKGHKEHKEHREGSSRKSHRGPDAHRDPGGDKRRSRSRERNH
ncbi:folate-sensitive fragile site protein Fra10Ac1-domain-containing protein [Mortierella sp. GBAus27b]|nr:folate-sensitive fragile site protein Fra10Ac1-domain-containing protein [Mortierella sp. GBAus27b]